MRRIVIASLCLLAAISFTSSAAFADDMAKLEANKKTVAEFYDAVLNKKDYELALTYIGEAGYTQHNPGAKDGVEGMKGFIGFLKSKYPDNHSEIKRIFAEGDYVITHVHAVREPGTRGNAIVDIFRLDDKGKVVEHWDAVQPIPEEAMNDNTMF
ncbi:nuclear transport factor 2 family protein [Oricola sp.]|uniref:nuclear transport factor 2 family protein n=1 Tax=Oricola sp. TaxID=1979950 RepID=UPI000C8AF89C|nr:polyketide cyclase [Ahrensia sp.]MCK5747469.1 nuclear transport factor 2 family protein [Oricola sp.]